MANISVIIGPPGTGKTTTLSHWAARAAVRYGHDKVIVCSLTRTAAYRAARSIELPYQQFGTVHAFAFRALGSPELAETDKAIKEWNKEYPDFALSWHGQGRTPDDGHLMPEESTSGDALKLEYTRLRTLGVFRDNPVWQRGTLRGFKERWEDFKTQNHWLDFCDLIEVAGKEIDTAPGEPAVILLDEGQDIAQSEFRLLRRWAEKAEHFVVAADPGQAIFSFRGSDPLLVQRLWDEHDSARKPLEQSYRLPQAIYDYAWTWQERFRQTRKVPYLARKDDKGNVVQGEVWRCAAFNTFTDHTVRVLLEPYLDEGKEVLFQTTCGYMLDPIIRALRDAGIPFHNSLRPSNGKWNPLPQRRGRGFTIVDRVLAFSRPRADLWEEQARYWSAADVKCWASALPSKNVFSRGGHAMVEALGDDAGDEDIAGAFATWFLPDVLSLIVPKPDIGWYLSQVKGSDNLRDYVEKVIARYGVKQLQERPLVSVGTIHSTKGGEAAVVIVSPDLSLEAANAARMSEESREECLRIFYVGCTRAVETLCLAAPSTRVAVRW